MHAAVKLLQELIRLPSVNPAFLPTTDPRVGEARVIDHLASIARARGLRVRRQRVSNGRKNLLVSTPPAGPVKRRLLLAPHLDTIGEPSLATLLKPRIEGDKLFGRGACDTKGSVAAMFTALLSFAELPSDQRLGTEIVFAGLADEENAQSGSRALAASGFTADLAVVGEPTDLKLVTAHKGDLWLKVETHGKSAHGSKPHLGVNAVHAMARVVELIETSYAAQLAKRKHPLLGSPTVNVGAIVGGSQPNIVPNHCAILIDRRTIPGEKDAEVVNEIKRALKAARCRAEVSDMKTGACLPLQTEASNPHVAAFLRHLGQAEPLGVDFFCDAAILGAAGIPSVVFGPGSIRQAHTADEWISMRSLTRAHDLLFGFMKRFSLQTDSQKGPR